MSNFFTLYLALTKGKIGKVKKNMFFWNTSQNSRKKTKSVKLAQTWSILADLGAILADLGAILADLGVILADLGSILAHLGASLLDLGASLADLGANLSRTSS